MAQKVFMVTHTHEMNPGEDDDKLIGVYSTKEKADLAAGRAKTLPGFRDHPDGFLVEPDVLDEDHWREGFARVYGGQKRDPVPSTLKSKSRKRAKTNAKQKHRKER